MEAEPAGPVVVLGTEVGLPLASPVMPVVLEPPPELRAPPGAIAPPPGAIVFGLFIAPGVVAPGAVVFWPDGPVLWANVAPVIAKAIVPASAVIFNMCSPSR